jgi:ferric-dicitrate binding protein FerR (iron transport regulator)
MPPELRQALGSGPSAEPLVRLWDALGAAPPPRPDVLDDAAALAELGQRLERPSPVHRRPLHPDRPAHSRATGRLAPMIWWGALACILAAVAAGAWAWRQPVTAAAGAGEQVAVRLPDGSTATLNSGSRLRYARRFEAWPFVPAPARAVHLEGEAFFDVVHTGRPFAVETFDARVEVLGTQFNVRAHTEPVAGGTRVTLASGRVRVVAAGDAAVLAEPGASARVPPDAGASLRVARVPLPQALAWRADGFAAVDEPLPAVLAEIERRFAVEVTVEGTVPADAMNLLYPQGATAEQILHDICLAEGCRFWRTSRGFGLHME